MISAKDILAIMRKNNVQADLENLNYSLPLTEQRVDSLDMISILFALEEDYGIKIPEEDSNKGKLASINAMVEYVNTKKA